MRTEESTLRFAELSARTGLEPELALRLEADPKAVFAEFGLPASAAAWVPEPSGAGLQNLTALAKEDAVVMYSTMCIASEADAPAQAVA